MKLSIVAALFAALYAQAQTAERIDFNREIRPILAEKCWRCHGPDAANLKVPLRLDSEAPIKADLGRGRRAAVPGSPEQSEIVRRIRAADDSLRMPPVYSGSSLTQREISLLTEWIRQGAGWQQHWSFITPRRPKPPATGKRWAKNPVDHFVLARLEREGLRPSPEADRATLIRRLSFDLTGLPPAPGEIDGFLNDSSPGAYEKLVDRLLDSPRYGERMAFEWLDAARYADTNGYQIDGERSMWRWRDWVIGAFNRNMPFDQFTIEQLAGDLLPAPTLDQRIATGFNRNHRANAEDGIVPEEYAAEYVVDRVDTTATVFLGLTLGCARCHNHKYDPFTQEEYYRFFAYFNSIREDGRASNYGNSAPWIAAPTAEQQKQWSALTAEMAGIQKNLDLLVEKHRDTRAQWEASLSGGRTHWLPPDNLVVRHSLDPDDKVEVLLPSLRINPAKPDSMPEPIKTEAGEQPGFRDRVPTYVEAPTGQGIALERDVFFDAGKVADFYFRDRLKNYKDQFAVSAWFYPESEQSGAIVTHMQERSEEQENNLPKGKGYGLFFNNGKVHFNLVNVWADDAFRVETEETLPLRQWYHVIATFDSTEPHEKVRIYLNGQPQKLKVNLGRLFRPFGDTRANLRIGGGGGPDWLFKGRIDEVRIYRSLPDANEIAILSCPESLEQIAAIPDSRRTIGQRLKILHAWLDKAAPSELRTLSKNLSDLRQSKSALEAEFPTVMVMQELPQPRPAHILKRGAYDSPGKPVERGTPAVLRPATEEASKNRLGLARWLVNPENPLTARVTVNRLWQMLFGAGLVRTVEDFGVQGEAPSHPELLDWLAVEFQSSGWNVKSVLRTMVTSATYRQASIATQEVLKRDPENRLLARGPRYRLPAEMIRDQALLASGLLVERLGGPPARPYQPENLWKDMTFSNMTEYNRDKGEGLWRRSLYTFWKRTVLNPGMFVLDASAREFCTVRETRTNTPLQALNLMNDVTYVEAARLLAGRALSEGGTSAEDRLSWAFRAVTSRRPGNDEQRILLENLKAQLELFRAQPAAAASLLAVGERQNGTGTDPAELAAYTAVASLILNLDEAMTKR